MESQFEIQNEIAISKLSMNVVPEPVEEESKEIKEENRKLLYHEPAGDIEYFSDHEREESLLKIKDRRQKIDNPHKWPYRVQGIIIADVVVDGEDYFKKSSGTIIGPNLVLTAAHAVYDRKLGQELDKNKMTFFYPVKDGDDTNYLECKIKKVYYPKEYTLKLQNDDQYDNSVKENDYALLVLDKNVGHETGSFKIYPYSKESLTGKEAYIYGYPIEENGHVLRGMKGTFEVPKSDIINHYIDTKEGQSGAAIYIQENEEYYIIGVHVLGLDPRKQCNRAVYINEDKLNRFEPYLNLSEQSRALRAPPDKRGLPYSYALDYMILKPFELPNEPTIPSRAASASLKAGGLSYGYCSFNLNAEPFEPIRF